MQAAWMLRSQQMLTELAFWLALIGYNPRQPSLSQTIYLIYAILFFSAWGLAVTGLISGAAGQFLLIVQPFDPYSAAIEITLLIIVVWFLYSLGKALRRSPLYFDEDDAGLICLTPIPRKIIALVWYPGAWVSSALPFAAVAVVIGFALIDIQVSPPLTIPLLLEYLRSGLRALAMLVPLQAGLLAWVWAAGFFRLNPMRYPARRAWVAPAIALLLLAAWFLGKSSVWPVVSWFLAYPLAGAYRGEHFLLSLLFALAVAGAGLLSMYRLAGPISLSRAAQESAERHTSIGGTLWGNTDLRKQASLQGRLRGARAPTRLPGGKGIWSIPWRQVLQQARSFGLGEIAAWVSLLLAALIFFILPDPGARAWAVVGWALLSAERVSAHLRSDLAHWWLFKQVPQSSQVAILAELVVPWLGICLMTWLAWAVIPAKNTLETWVSFLLIPPASAAICLATACDLLRQAGVSRLLVESAPEVTALGVLGGLVCIGAGLLASSTLWGRPIPTFFPALIGALITAALAYLLWRIASRLLKTLK